MRISTIIALAAIASISTAHAGQQIEADNGQKLEIFGAARAPNGTVYVDVSAVGGPGETGPGFMLQFDCHGHMFERSIGEYTYIPPRSVAAKIAQIACGGAKKS